MSGYYDQVNMEKHLKKDILCIKYLNLVKKETYPDQKIYYTMTHQNKEMKIFYYPEYKKLKIQLNIPYFLLGHNFCITIEQEKHVIEYISNVLNTDMFEADTTYFEYGLICELPYPFQEIHNSHIKIKGMNTEVYPHGKYYTDRNMWHKLYDAQKNIKNKLDKKEREILKETTNYTEDKFYMKVENRYIKPELALKTRGIIIKDLFDEKMIRLCNDDLLNKYESIKKTGSVEITSKKELSCSAIYLIALKQVEKVIGINSEELYKNVVKSYSHILTPEDRKSRMKQMRKMSENIVTSSCRYDVSELLRQSLQIN